MNKTQRVFLVLGLLGFVLLGLFPPWIEKVDTAGVHVEKAVDYAFIGAQPTPTALRCWDTWTPPGGCCSGALAQHPEQCEPGTGFSKNFISVEIDGTRLATSWIMTVVVIGGLLLLFRRPSVTPAQEDTTGVKGEEVH